MVVKAKVPKLIGMQLYQARLEAEKWNLRLVPGNTTGCNLSQYGKIIKQGAKAGALFDPRKGLAVKICARKPAATPAPQPTASPAGRYVVFGVNAGPNLFIGTEDSLKGRSMSSFANGGLSSNKVTYKALSPVYSNLAAAQQDFCKGVAVKTTWGMAAPCRELITFRDGVRYASCESSVRAAISKYCPKFAQYGTVYGTIVK